MNDIEHIKKLIEKHKKFQAEGNKHFLYYTQQDLDEALVNAETIEETKLLLGGGANPNKRFLGENEAITHAKSIDQMQALVEAGAEITDHDFRDCMWNNRGGDWKEKCHFLLSHQVDNKGSIPTWKSMFDCVDNPINVNPDVWYADSLKARWNELGTDIGREHDKMLRKGEKLKSEACTALGINVQDVKRCKCISDSLMQIDYYLNHQDGYICLASMNNHKFTQIGKFDAPHGYGPIEDFYALEPLGKNLYATFSGVHDGLLTGNFSYIGSYGAAFLTINKEGIKDGITSDSLSDAISFLRDQKDKSYLSQTLKEQLLQRYPDVALQKSGAINLSKSEIMDCISRTDNNLSKIKGLKTYCKVVSKEDVFQTAEDKAKLIDMINTENIDKIEVNENRLSDLKGVSIKDLADGYSETALLATKAYDCSHLSGLLQVAIEAPNTPAFDLISARYREQYGNVVNDITERADEIIKLPYKKMFFETITKDNSNAPEANFLDAFTDKIRDLAMKKYGQEDWYTSISEAAKNPEFMKECDKVWGEMFAEADKYASYKPNEHNNAYIRQMFSDKAEQLHEFVAMQKTGDFAEVLDETIKYHQRVGKMMAAIREYSKDNEVSFNGNLHFDLVDAGIETKKEAKRCLDIWRSANERPDRYGSPYNDYSIRQIAQIAKSNVMQDWMYPVMMDAIRNEVLSTSEGRMPSERTLFDCCKAWKVCPQMPQRLAKEVGTYSLKGRMLAGAIFEKMVEEGKTTSEEWRENKELHQKFYEELNRAQKMPREQAFKQYIPDTPVNRKRVIGMGMEEKGIENTPENFKALYREAREKGIFDKMLAKPEDAKTTFSSRLLVEMARRKFDQSK